MRAGVCVCVCDYIRLQRKQHLGLRFLVGIHKILNQVGSLRLRPLPSQQPTPDTIRHVPEKKTTKKVRGHVNLKQKACFWRKSTRPDFRHSKQNWLYWSLRTLVRKKCWESGSPLQSTRRTQKWPKCGANFPVSRLLNWMSRWTWWPPETLRQWTAPLQWYTCAWVCNNIAPPPIVSISGPTLNSFRVLYCARCWSCPEVVTDGVIPLVGGNAFSHFDKSPKNQRLFWNFKSVYFVLGETFCVLFICIIISSSVQV